MRGVTLRGDGRPVGAAAPESRRSTALEGHGGRAVVGPPQPSPGSRLGRGVIAIDKDGDAHRARRAGLGQACRDCVCGARGRNWVG